MVIAASSIFSTYFLLFSQYWVGEHRRYWPDCANAQSSLDLRLSAYVLRSLCSVAALFTQIFWAYADSKGPDQTAHTRSLIKAFAVFVYRIIGSWRIHRCIVRNRINCAGWVSWTDLDLYWFVPMSPFLKMPLKYEPRHSISCKPHCAPSKGSERPAHRRRLIKGFARHLVGSQVSKASSDRQRRRWSACSDA